MSENFKGTKRKRERETFCGSNGWCGRQLCGHRWASGSPGSRVCGKAAPTRLSQVSVLLERLKPEQVISSNSSVFLAVSLGFTFLSEIFACVTVFYSNR